MITEINSKGTLIISAENELEAYALKKWTYDNLNVKNSDVLLNMMVKTSVDEDEMIMMSMFEGVTHEQRDKAHELKIKDFDDKFFNDKFLHEVGLFSKHYFVRNNVIALANKIHKEINISKEVIVGMFNHELVKIEDIES